MREIIDKENVLKRLHDAIRYLEDKEWSDKRAAPHIDTIIDVITFLKKPQIEAEPEIEGGGSTWWYVCSECHGAIDNYDSFCKHCGAKMKKE